MPEGRDEGMLQRSKTSTPPTHGNGFLDTEALFDVLSNPRRRAVVETVDMADKSVSMSELVDEVAKREYDTTINNISSTERNRVYTSIYQTHLPRLDEADVINYNEDTKEITASDHTSMAQMFLEAATQPDILSDSAEARWNRYFAISSGASAFLYFVNEFLTPSIGFFTYDIFLSLFIILILTTITAIYTIQSLSRHYLNK